MKILIEAECEKNYLAKCHEALRTGLKATFDTRCFGKGYSGYREDFTNYREIIDYVFPDDQPDIIIVECQIAPNLPERINYKGLSDIDIPKAIVLGDFWNVTDSVEHIESFIECLEGHGISLILSYFPQPLEILKKYSKKIDIAFLPTCFDPSIFNSWNCPKQFDVGFLAAGTVEYTHFYPERFQIHNLMRSQENFSYLWAQHPGWQQHTEIHPLVGKEFSKAINSCEIFITTGGVLKNPQPKYMEALASGVVLLADMPIGGPDIGLVNNVNFVEIQSENILDQINYLINNKELCRQIAANGYELAIQRHSCFIRAIEFHAILRALNIYN